MKFSELTPDHTFPDETLYLDEARVRRYLDATGDDTDIYWNGDSPALVPPLAVAAFAFEALARGVTLEPGSLHTGQELTFHRAIAVGETLTARSRVVSSSRRRDVTALVIENAGLDARNAPVLTGRMTLFIADADGTSMPVVASGRRPSAIAHDMAVAPRRYPPIDLQPGVDLPRIVRTVSQDRIDAYAIASGDDNPIHLDHDFAATTPFGTTVAHGMLLLSYLSTGLTRAFGRAWLETGSLKARFRNPAPVDSTTTAGGTIERVEDDDVQYAVCALRLHDTVGESLVTGEARVRVAVPARGA